MFDIVMNGGWHLVAHFVGLFVVSVILLTAGKRADRNGEFETGLILRTASRVGSFLMAFYMWAITFWILGITFIP